MKSTHFLVLASLLAATACAAQQQEPQWVMVPMEPVIQVAQSTGQEIALCRVEDERGWYVYRPC